MEYEILKKPVVNKSIIMISCLMVFSIFFQCKNETVKNDSAIQIKLNAQKIKNTKKMSELFNVHKYIPLETSDDCIIGEISKLIVADSSFWIRDDISNSVFCFDYNGKFKFKVNSIGKGPGEYQDITDFSYQNNRLIIFETGRKLLEYNMQGKYTTEKEINIHATEFNMMDSLHACFFCNYSMKTPYNVLVSENTKFKIVKKYLPTSYLTGPINLVRKPSNSSMFCNTLSLWEHYNDTIYQLKGGQISQKYSIDYSNDNVQIAKKILKMVNGKNVNASIVYKYEKEKNYCSLLTVQETNRGLFFLYQQDTFFHYVFYEKETGKLIDLSKEMNSESPNPPLENDLDEGMHAFAAADKNYTYSIVNSYDLMSSTQPNEPLDLIKADLDENDNPIIVQLSQKRL